MLKIPFTVKFGAKGDYRSFANDGWHHDPSDPSHTWCSSSAELLLPVGSQSKDLHIRFEAMPAQARGIEQEIFLYVNGLFVAFWQISRDGNFSARIPARYLSGNECLINFVAPNAVSPKSLRASEDERILSVALSSLSVTVAR